MRQCEVQTVLNSSNRSQQGITFIELLVVLAVLAILLAFAAPSIDRIAARADVRQATDELVQGFREARAAARYNNTEVTVTLLSDHQQNRVNFELGEMKNRPDESGAQLGQFMFLADIELPSAIRMDSAPARFVFNPDGTVEQTGLIILTSIYEPEQAATVMVENRMGQVRAHRNSASGH